MKKLNLKNVVKTCLILLIVALYISGCSAIKDVNKSLAKFNKDNNAGDSELIVSRKLFVHYKWIPDPKPGCNITTVPELTDKMVKIAKLTLSAPVDIRTGKPQKKSVDLMRQTFHREACKIGADGLIDVNRQDHEITGFVWSFKKRMKIPYN